MPGEILKRYEAMVSKSLEQRIKEFLTSIKREVFNELIRDYMTLLPQQVVRTEDGKLELMRELGRVKDLEMTLFISDGGSLFRTYPADSFIPVVKTAPTFTTDERTQILITLEKATLGTKPGEVPAMIVPDGFFVFNFQGRWAAGGNEDEWRDYYIVIEAVSLARAFEVLQDRLLIMRPNCFMSFYVYFGGKWQALKRDPLTDYPVMPAVEPQKSSAA